MIVFAVLCLIAFMIFTLVKNALIGIQLSSSDSFHGNIELLIPITLRSEFYLEPWVRALQNFRSPEANLRIHILIDGYHPALATWQELQQKLPFVELHSFAMRPEEVSPVPWMINQISARIHSQVVIIGDAELVPREAAFLSLAHHISSNGRPYFVLPQTAKLSFLGESVAALNPNLALASVFSFRKYRRNLSHPLINIAQGWMGMPLQLFKDLDWNKMPLPFWKQSITEQWARSKQSYGLAFGEKYLLRFYPTERGVQIQQMKAHWMELWSNGDRAGLWLYWATLVIWFFPVVSFWFYPLWSMATLTLLLVYRFFAKVVFQERWFSMLLHPFGFIVWIAAFTWWGIEVLRRKSVSPGPSRH